MRLANFLLPALLLAAQGALCVETDDQPAPLVQSSWTVTEIGGQAALEGHPVTLEFAAPGQVAGNAGCNRFGGGCRFDGELIHISRLRATRRYCDDAVMEQERRFLKLLEAAITWEVTADDTLLLDGHEGAIKARREPTAAADE